MATDKQRVALTSIAASAGLTVAKAAVGLGTGSLAILSEAAHSLIDLVATVITYFAVRIGDKPADEEHHYGHGKVESLSALAETALLFVLCGVVIWEAVKRLAGAEAYAVEATTAAFAVMGVSIVIDFFRSRALYKAAKEHSSEALEADALHFGSDMWSSAAVIIGLFGVKFGHPWPAGAAERIVAVARKVRGVVDIDRVRARQVGPTLFADLDVAASRTLPLDRVEALKAEIANRVRAAMSGTELNVTVTPRA